ncbi:MAG: thioredoxin [Clostridiales bacterium]|jgi:thioredoxin 1|nr:thioredoxin [Clostridiales bacterium]
MSVLHLTKESFESEVLASDIPVLVDFYATWCGPCMMVAPIVEEIAAENPEMKICKVDVDAEPEIARDFQIMSIPTLLVFKDGELTAKAVGARSKEQILEMLNG